MLVTATTAAQQDFLYTPVYGLAYAPPTHKQTIDIVENEGVRNAVLQTSINKTQLLY